MSNFLKYLFLTFIIVTSYIAGAADNLNQLKSNYTDVLKDTELHAGTLTAKISGNSSFCLNTPNATITFEGEGGQPPYTFTYEVDRSPQPVVRTTGNNKSVQVAVNTNSAKDITIKITKIKDNNSLEENQDVSRTVTINELPNAGFTFTNDNSCSGTNIQFTSSVNGTGPYTYTWDFGDNTTSNTQNPTHAFSSLGCGTTTFKVTLTIFDGNGCSKTVAKDVKVIQKPDVEFVDSNNPFNQFSNCGKASIANPNFSINVENKSISASCISTYSIDWGDGSPITNNANFPISRTYNKLGAFNLVITAKGNNGCEHKTNYIVKNVTNPSIGVTSPGTTTNLCAPTEELKFEIAKWGNNSPGTKYEIDYGDGTSITSLDQDDLVKTTNYNSADPISSKNYPIPHSYKKSNCPEKEFIVTVTASNVCSSTTGTVNNITVLTKPEANFDFTSPCLKTSTKFINTTTTGYNPDCSKTTEYTWDFGDGSKPVVETTDSPKDITHTYDITGTFTVTLKVKNFCGETIKTKQIIVGPLPTATIIGGATVCKGDPSPEITFTGTKGNAPFTFTYKINSGSAQSIKTTSGNSVKWPVSTSTDGTFKYSLLSVQDANGCSQNQTGDATIVVKPTPSAAISGTANVCRNNTYPVITFTGSGGTSPYTFTYNINNGADKTISTATGNSATIQVPTENTGTFKYNLVGVTDGSANACKSSSTGTTTVTINEPPATLTLIDYEYCNGVTTTPIVFTNSVVGTTYKWVNNNPSIGLAASETGNIPAFTAKNTTSNAVTATISVTPNANGCSGTAQTFKLKVNPSASVAFTPGNQTICSGETSQQVKLSSSTAGATFTWTTTQPPGITGVLTNGTDVIPAQTLTNSTNAPIDVIYKAKATLAGAKTCAGTEYSYTITVNPKPVIQQTYNTNCCSNTPFTVSPNNGGGNLVPVGTTYTWGAPIVNPVGAVTGSSEQKTAQSTINQALVNNTSANATVTYTVIPTYKGCAGNPFEINVEVYPVATVNKVNDITFCNTEQSPLIDFKGGPIGTIYNWTSNNPNIGMPASGTNSIAPFTAINKGNAIVKATITVTPVFNNCIGTPMQFTITVNPTAQVNNPSVKNLCNGQAASINFTSVNTGGIQTYSWTNDNTAIGLANNGNGNISFIPENTGSSAITANLTVTPTFENNGVKCSGKTELFSIIVHPTPTVNQPVSQTLCSGISTNEIVFSGNFSETIYNWSNNNTSIGLAANGKGDIPSFVAKNNSAKPITATITVTPVKDGCTGEPKSFTITVNPAGIMTKQPVSSEVCLGDIPKQLVIEVTNGFGTPTFQWYSNNINSNTGGTIITGANQPIFNPPYSKADTSFYYCVVSFPAGDCNVMVSEVARVAINALPEIADITLEIISGDIINIQPELLIGNIVPNGTTYTWPMPDVSPPNAITGASAQSIPQTTISQILTNKTTGIATVIYKLQPTSGLCKGPVFLVTVKVNPPLYPNAEITPISCFNANDGKIETKIQGGSPIKPGNSYITNWTGPNGFSASTPNIYNLKPGTYNLEIIDALGMKSKTSYNIIEPKEINIETNERKDISCFGAANGLIAISISGGTGAYKIEWTKNNKFFSSNEDLKNLEQGTYEVTITDEKNCGPVSKSYTINEPDALALKIKEQTNVKCFGDATGAVTVDVQGGTKIEVAPGIFDYKYAWKGTKGFASSLKDLSGIPADNYQLKVTDKNECTQLLPVEVKQTEQITIQSKQTPITCYGDDNATINLIISGGQPPYQAQWANFATGFYQDNLSAGDYPVTVIDAYGCKKSLTETILEADVFTMSPVIKQISCYGANNGSIKLNFRGGTPPIKFAWADGSSAGATRNNLLPGIYSVNISEGKGCSINESFTIIEPLPFSLDAKITNSLGCIEKNQGAIDLTVSGGLPPYLFTWSNGAKSEDLVNIPGGTYSLNATDAKGCSNTAVYVVDRPEELKLNAIIKMKYDCSTQKISAFCSATVNGGLPPHKFSWSNGTVTGIYNEFMETDQNGMVLLEATDSQGCTSNYSFNVIIPELSIDYTLLNCDERLFQFNVIAPSSNEKYAYEWDFGDGTYSTVEKPIHSFQKSGIYNVKLKLQGETLPCAIHYNLIVEVEPRPQIILDKQPIICENEPMVFHAKGADHYVWDDATASDSIIITNEGSYSVVGFTNAGCTDTLRFDITYFENFGYRIFKDKESVSNLDREVHFWTDDIANSKYTWSFGDGFKGYSTDLRHAYKIKNDGFFIVQLNVLNPYKCIETDSARIAINLESAPNTFTPNDDGTNDIFMSGWRLEIYNRNGVLIYKGNNGWDGNDLNGHPVDNDTYFSIIHDDSEEGGKVITNYVTVIR
jgi:PKD repeat protein